MGKRDGAVHPSDVHRKASALRLRKANAESRRTQRDSAFKKQTTEELEEQVEKIDRQTKSGTADAHAGDRKKRLEKEIADAKVREIEAAKNAKNVVVAERVNIKGLGKIFRSDRGDGSMKLLKAGSDEDDSSEDDSDAAAGNSRDPYASRLAQRLAASEASAYCYDDKVRSALPLALLPGAGSKARLKRIERGEEDDTEIVASRLASSSSSSSSAAKRSKTGEEEVDDLLVPDLPPGLVKPPEGYEIPAYAFGRGLIEATKPVYDATTSTKSEVANKDASVSSITTTSEPASTAVVNAVATAISSTSASSLPYATLTSTPTTNTSLLLSHLSPPPPRSVLPPTVLRSAPLPPPPPPSHQSNPNSYAPPSMYLSSSALHSPLLPHPHAFVPPPPPPRAYAPAPSSSPAGPYTITHLPPPPPPPPRSVPPPAPISSTYGSGVRLINTPGPNDRYAPSSSSSSSAPSVPSSTPYSHASASFHRGGIGAAPVSFAHAGGVGRGMSHHSSRSSAGVNPSDPLDPNADGAKEIIDDRNAKDAARRYGARNHAAAPTPAAPASIGVTAPPSSIVASSLLPSSTLPLSKPQSTFRPSFVPSSILVRHRPAAAVAPSRARTGGAINAAPHVTESSTKATTSADANMDDFMSGLGRM